jgi:hypothetical protein
MSARTGVAVLAAVASLAATGCGEGVTKPGAANTYTLTDVAAQCQSAPVSGGFALVELTGDIASTNETVNITVPCRIKLEGPSTIGITGSTLVSKSLVLVTDEEQHRVTLTRALIKSNDATAGLLVDLNGVGDSLVSLETTYSYPKSVWLRVVPKDAVQTASQLQMIRNQIWADNAAADGIQLVADEGSGVANFVDLTVNTVASANVIVHAGKCYAQSVNVPTACKEPAPVIPLATPAP